jgi:hypothetical protein
VSREPVLVELDAERMRSLLDELDIRLQGRGVKASIYVVGGAAMALEYGRDGLTPDIDAVVGHRAVVEEARVLAERHGLPESWLNSNAAGWVPPRPSWALRRATKLGLTVHVAPAEHVLAMKLIALRRKDRPDIRLLIQHCGMVDATANDYADLLEQIYAGEGLLAQMFGIADDPEKVRREAVLIGEWAHQFVAPLRT